MVTLYDWPGWRVKSGWSNPKGPQGCPRDEVCLVDPRDIAQEAQLVYREWQGAIVMDRVDWVSRHAEAGLVCSPKTGPAEMGVSRVG